MTFTPDDGACGPTTKTKKFTTGKCGGDKPTNGPDNGKGKCCGCICKTLFWAALVASILAAIGIIVAGCTWGTPAFPYVAAAAAALLASAIAAFTAFVIVCRWGRFCKSLHTLATVLGWVDTITFALSLIGTALALMGVDADLLPCSLGALVASGYLAAAQLVVRKIADYFGCSTWDDHHRVPRL